MTEAQVEITPSGRLEAAFEMFSQVSDTLGESFSMLESRVGELTRELAAAHSGRLAELAEKEALANRLSALVSILPGGVVVVDRNGIVIEANVEAVSLFGRDVIGEAWSDLVPQDNGEVIDIELADGKHVSMTRRALPDEAGSEVILLADLTASRELQAIQNREARLIALGELAGRVAHQIRTPVASAMLYLSQLRSPVLDDVGRLRVAHKVEGRLQHIEELIESMLTFIRGGDGALGEFDVAGLMSELKTTLAPALADKGGTMMMMSDVPASLTLVGARNDLLSVLIAIAENAIGLIDVPAIAVRVEADDRFVDIFVADNGPGIPREIESRLFDPFFSTRANGTGLGLAIAAVTARNHGGDLTVQANEYGGATFRLRLARYGAEDVARRGRSID